MHVFNCTPVDVGGKSTATGHVTADVVTLHPDQYVPISAEPSGGTTPLTRPPRTDSPLAVRPAGGVWGGLESAGVGAGRL